MKQYFRSGSSDKKLSMEEVGQRIVDFIHKYEGYDFEIRIGSDSQELSAKRGKHIIQYATIIFVYRIGYGGIYFLTKEKDTIKSSEDYINIWQRIPKEAEKSIKIAEQITKYIVPKCVEAKSDITIDIDVGPNGRSRDTIQTVMGMAKGYGYCVSVKPDAIASRAADKHCRR